LAALALLPPGVPYELRILGCGPLESRWRRIARRLGVEPHCQWLGWLDHPQALEQYIWADVFVFTSLRDTSGNVVLEAFANGTPVVCLDHQGMADIVTDECGVKLAVSSPRKVISALRDVLAHWHQNRDELERLSHGAFRRAEYYAWDRQGRRMSAIYNEVLRLRDSAQPDIAVELRQKKQESELPADSLTGSLPTAIAARRS
jgi:glycosyltransferase involved in cell wall biosynthesis